MWHNDKQGVKRLFRVASTKASLPREGEAMLLYPCPAYCSWDILDSSKFPGKDQLKEIPLQRIEAKMMFNNAVGIEELNHSGLYHNPRVWLEEGKKYLIMVIWRSGWLWLCKGVKQMTSETLCSPGFWCFYPYKWAVSEQAECLKYQHLSLCNVSAWG